ncbi:MAG: hypothetical protein ACR2OZ_14040 [Verrucomicrobiales bacterium]
MWKILSWVAVGLLAVAAFFSYKNVAQFKAERQLLEIAKTNSQKVRDAIKQADTSLAEDRATRKATEDERDALEKKVTDAKGKADDMTRQVAEKKTELEQESARLAEVEKKIADAGGVEAMKKQLADVQGEKANLDESVSSMRQQIAIAVERTTQFQQQIAAMKTREVWQQQGIIEDSFRSRVREVDSNYGFVIIDAGTKNGLTSGATLDVRRGGRVIGQLRVTNIEQNRAAADPIKGSVAEGESIQRGDTVSVAQISKASLWRRNQQSIPPSQPAVPGAQPGQAAKPGAPAVPATPGAPGEAPAPVDPFAPVPAAPTGTPPDSTTPTAPAPEPPFTSPATPPAAPGTAPATPATPATPPGTPATPPSDPFAN